MLKSQALQLLDAKICACDRCGELSEYRRANHYRHVPGAGNAAARVMFLGEAPGENEAKTGLPFCGKAGNLLTNIIRAAGWSRESVYICNTIKCRPPNNRDPEAAEAANCRPFLDMQIRVVDPEWIVCLGRVASDYLLGGDGCSLAGYRGKVHDYNGRKVVCTYHPSYVQRLHDDPAAMREAKAQVWEDLRPVLESLRGAAAPV